MVRLGGESNDPAWAGSEFLVYHTFEVAPIELSGTASKTALSIPFQVPAPPIHDHVLNRQTRDVSNPFIWTTVEAQLAIASSECLYRLGSLLPPEPWIVDDISHSLPTIAASHLQKSPFVVVLVGGIHKGPGSGP